MDPILAKALDTSTSGDTPAMALMREARMKLILSNRLLGALVSRAKLEELPNTNGVATFRFDGSTIAFNNQFVENFDGVGRVGTVDGLAEFLGTAVNVCIGDGTINPALVEALKKQLED